MGTCFKSSIKSLSQPSSRLNLSGIMQVYFVLLLVAAASATPLNPATITKHNINNAPVLNLNHKNVHLTQQVPVVDTYTTLNQAVPQVYTTLNKVVPQQMVPQVYTTLGKQVVPEVYTQVQKQIVPQVYTTLNQVVPQVQNLVHTAVQTPVQVDTQLFKTLNTVQTPVQVDTQLFKTLNTVQTPVQVLTQQMPITQQYVKTLQTVAQTPVQLTPGYVAANQGAVHTAPLPEGPSKDGFFASHHIN